jgi:hypothetical protein
MIREGRPKKKTCPLCLVKGLKRGRKGHMKTDMFYYIKAKSILTRYWISSNG